MHKLEQLLYNIDIKQIIGNTDILIKSICLDSREAQQDSLFIAIPGSTSDGHQYISEAIYAGSKVIVCQSNVEPIVPGITYIYVDNSSKSLGLISSNFYKNPSQKLQLIA